MYFYLGQIIKICKYIKDGNRVNKVTEFSNNSTPSKSETSESLSTPYCDDL